MIKEVKRGTLLTLCFPHKIVAHLKKDVKKTYIVNQEISLLTPTVVHFHDPTTTTEDFNEITKTAEDCHNLSTTAEVFQNLTATAEDFHDLTATAED